MKVRNRKKMITETTKSSSVEITRRIEVMLLARCSDSDFVYEIESLKQSIKSTSLPIRQTIEFIVTLRSAEDPREFLTFESRIKDLEVRLDFYSVPNYNFNLIETNVSDVELKERMIKAFESYSSFNLEFSIE